MLVVEVLVNTTLTHEPPVLFHRRSEKSGVGLRGFTMPHDDWLLRESLQPRPRSSLSIRFS